LLPLAAEIFLDCVAHQARLMHRFTFRLDTEPSLAVRRVANILHFVRPAILEILGRCDCKANMTPPPAPPIPRKTPLTGLGQFDSLAGQQPRRAPVVQTDSGGSGASSFVPVIDIAPYLAGTPDGKRRVAAQLDRACREVGFYIIVGHGVDPGSIAQVEAA